MRKVRPKLNTSFVILNSTWCLRFMRDAGTNELKAYFLLHLLSLLRARTSYFSIFLQSFPKARKIRQVWSPLKQKRQMTRCRMHVVRCTPSRICWTFWEEKSRVRTSELSSLGFLSTFLKPFAAQVVQGLSFREGFYVVSTCKFNPILEQIHFARI